MIGTGSALPAATRSIISFISAGVPVTEPMMVLPVKGNMGSGVEKVPIRRACPNCLGNRNVVVLYEHEAACKQFTCKYGCKLKFCFSCLKFKSPSDPGCSLSTICKPAPPQTLAQLGVALKPVA